jgi:hypothetical protein
MDHIGPGGGRRATQPMPEKAETSHGVRLRPRGPADAAFRDPLRLAPGEPAGAAERACDRRVVGPFRDHHHGAVHAGVAQRVMQTLRRNGCPATTVADRQMQNPQRACPAIRFLMRRRDLSMRLRWRMTGRSGRTPRVRLIRLTISAHSSISAGNPANRADSSNGGKPCETQFSPVPSRPIFWANPRVGVRHSP